MKYARWLTTVAVVACMTGASQAQPSGPDLTVNVRADRHRISPDIYGINNYDADSGIFAAMPIPVQRWGGNATSLYNWQVDSSNAGLDWFYIGGSGTDPAQVVPGQTVDNIVRFDRRHGARSVVTVPITGWVNKFSQYNCSYPQNLYPDQGIQWGWTAFWPYFADGSPTVANGSLCGSGLSPANDGSEIVQTDPSRNHLAVDPSWMRSWIQHLVHVGGRDGEGKRPMIYQMDNEPESWNYIHYDIHPAATQYDELVKDTIAYAAMIKDVNHDAAVLGPSNCCVWSQWGLSSDNIGADGVAGPFPAPYGVPWYQYYLSQMSDYEAHHHVRLLDYFDFHFYPEVDGVSIANDAAGDDATKAARLRSTRALWDPSYVTEDWMGTWFPTTYGTPMLIRNMRDWVGQYYPGTKTAITEYNWGGLEDINGAVAQADVLGIFGREGLDLATLWGPPAADQPGAFAFRMYLNYDGKGGRYGDVWVDSQSTDQSQLAVYGAQRTEDGMLTLMIVNKATTDLNSTLTIQGVRSGASADVFRYSSANLSSIARLPGVPVIGAGRPQDHGQLSGTINYTFPASSMTLFVVPVRGGGDDQ